MGSRYLKKSSLLKFYVPATRAAFYKGIFVAANNSTNQANKAGVCTIDQSIFLRCLCIG